MTKRLTLSLILVAAALLIPSTGFAGRPGTTEKYCTYYCVRCNSTQVQTCSYCGTTWSCGSCFTGSICAV